LDNAAEAYRGAEQAARRTSNERDLSVSHNRIGDVLLSQGDRDGALAAYRAALAIAETLARRDPANTQWQRDLSVSHNRIGDVLFSQGDRNRALTAYRTALAVRETLTRRDPTQWQRDLIVSYVKMAEAEPTAARAQLSRALDIARTLQSEGRLAPTDAWVIDDLTQRLGGTKE
jgi:tetratricopeptide (TPR) repeat protein